MGDWNYYDEAFADLSSLPAEERLQRLVTEWTTESSLIGGEDVRKLFVYAWPDGRDSIDDHSRELLTMLRWIAPVRDVETYLVGTLTVFRVAPHERGIRWTLDEASASAAATAGGASLFRATVASTDVLGHFTADGGNEVLLDPLNLSSVERISPA